MTVRVGKVPDCPSTHCLDGNTSPSEGILWGVVVLIDVVKCRCRQSRCKVLLLLFFFNTLHLVLWDLFAAMSLGLIDANKGTNVFSMRKGGQGGQCRCHQGPKFCSCFLFRIFCTFVPSEDAIYANKAKTVLQGREAMWSVRRERNIKKLVSPA